MRVVDWLQGLKLYQAANCYPGAFYNELLLLPLIWFAEKHQHPWQKKLDLKRFSMESGALGAGKRMLVYSSITIGSLIALYPRLQIAALINQVDLLVFPLWLYFSFP